MKKLLLCALIFTMQTIDTSNLCRGFVYTGQLFRRVEREIVECECNCWQQPKVKFEDGYGYGCVRCGHRLIPEDIFEKKTKESDTDNKTWDPVSKKYNRYEQAPECTRVLIGQIIS
ncbi:MAG: hypothetical protein NTZ68_02915 [Candidatus Dependentiae bacterium]|nr:hypothetical protein [Candidatus Dependentiae bacterium]